MVDAIGSLLIVLKTTASRRLYILGTMLKTVDTLKILINAIQFYVCLQEIW
jgi:hypothetical protein